MPAPPRGVEPRLIVRGVWEGKRASESEQSLGTYACGARVLSVTGKDGVTAQEAADPRGARTREHQRQDELVLAGQLEDADDRGHRRPRRGGEHGAHADQAV